MCLRGCRGAEDGEWPRSLGRRQVGASWESEVPGPPGTAGILQKPGEGDCSEAGLRPHCCFQARPPARPSQRGRQLLSAQSDHLKAVHPLNFSIPERI